MGELSRCLCCGAVFLVVAFCGQGVLGAEGVEEALASVMARDKQQLMQTMPRLDIELMFRFYGEYSKDLLDEWREKCSAHPAQSSDYLRRLAVHFQKMEDLRKTDPAEYGRLLGYETLQCRIRTLSREIRLLSVDGKGQVLPAVEEARRQMQLKKSKDELRGILAESFDESLRQQAYEVDKLEQEVAELRQIIVLRRKNREATLEQRFKALTGE